MKSLGISSLDSLINELSRLPGIGYKTAQRLAIFILKSDPQYPASLSEAIDRVKNEVQFCPKCYNLSEEGLCRICNNNYRDHSKICVVEDVVDIMAIEESNEYDGLYHVLGGVISPLAGVLPANLKISELMKRTEQEKTAEVLLALNPSTEGEATMIYISNRFKELNVRITRIASGIPIGSHLEYVDKATIGRAIQSRREL